MHRGSLFLLLACLLFIVPPALMQTDVEPVTVTVLPYLSYAPFYIAEQEGYFAAQGIDVEFISTMESVEVFPALLRGELDVHVEFLNAGLFNAIARGAEVQVVADKGFAAAGECSVNAFTARNDVLASGALESAEDFSTLRWQYEVDTVEQYMLERAYPDVVPLLDDLQNEPLPPFLFHDALLGDAVDVGFTGEPWITLAEQTGEASLWLSDAEAIPDLQLSMLLFGRRFLQDDPELGQRFMVAYLQGIRQFLEGKTERNIELVAEFTELDPAVVEAACWAHIDPTGAIRTEGVMEFQSWLFERGLIDAVVPVEDFWNPAYVEYANSVLGES